MLGHRKVNAKSQNKNLGTTWEGVSGHLSVPRKGVEIGLQTMYQN